MHGQYDILRALDQGEGIDIITKFCGSAMSLSKSSTEWWQSISSSPSAGIPKCKWMKDPVVSKLPAKLLTSLTAVCIEFSLAPRLSCTIFAVFHNGALVTTPFWARMVVPSERTTLLQAGDPSCSSSKKRSTRLFSRSLPL